MKKYHLLVIGCDDSTKIELVLSEKDKKFVESIVTVVNNEAVSNCQPTMELIEIVED